MQMGNMKPGYWTVLASCAALALGLGFAGAARAESASSALLAQGYQEWSKGHLDKAQKLYEKAVQLEPGSVEARMKLAGLLLSGNNFVASIKEYQKVIGLDPKNAKAFIGLAIAYMHSGDKGLTRAALNEALRLEPARKDQLAPLLAQLDKQDP